MLTRGKRRTLLLVRYVQQRHNLLEDIKCDSPLVNNLFNTIIRFAEPSIEETWTDILSKYIEPNSDIYTVTRV